MHKTTFLWHMKEKYAAMQGFTSDEAFSVKLLKFATTDEINQNKPQKPKI